MVGEAVAPPMSEAELEVRVPLAPLMDNAGSSADGGERRKLTSKERRAAGTMKKSKRNGRSGSVRNGYWDMLSPGPSSCMSSELAPTWAAPGDRGALPVVHEL